MKKLFTIVLVSFCTIAFLMAGGSKEQAADDGALHGSLTVATNASSPTFEAVEKVIELFMEENPDVEVEYTTYGSDTWSSHSAYPHLSSTLSQQMMEVLWQCQSRWSRVVSFTIRRFSRKLAGIMYLALLMSSISAVKM